MVFDLILNIHIRTINFFISFVIFSIHIVVNLHS